MTTGGSENSQKSARLGDILLQAGIIDRLQLNTALKYQREWDRKLGEALVELGFITEPVLAKVLSKFLNVPSVDLGQVRINPAAVQKVPKRLAEKYGLIPIEFEGDPSRPLLLVAMIDPTNLVATDEVAFTSGCKVKPVVSTHSEIEKAIRRHYGDDRVVDLFFEVPASSLTLAPSQASLPLSPLSGSVAVSPVGLGGDDSEGMVILRGGNETRIGGSSPRSIDWSSVSDRALLRGLVRLLLDKGVIQAEDLAEFLDSEGM